MFMTFEFPVQFYRNNIFYSEDGAWAYYKLSPFFYDYLDTDKKMQFMKRFSSFLWDIGTKVHILMLPRCRDVSDNAESYKEKISGPLTEIGRRHLDDITAQLLKTGESSIDYNFYIGIKLQEPDQGNFLSDLKAAWCDFRKGIRKTAGFDFIIKDEEKVKQYGQSERLCFQSVSTNLSVSRLEEKEMQFLIEWRFKGKLAEKSRELEAGENLLQLADVLVDGSCMHFIKLQNADRETYITFLPIGNMPYANDFPGMEYSYAVNLFEFPVSLNVRVEPLLNTDAGRTVGVLKKKVTGENNYAVENGEQVSDNMELAEQRVNVLEAKLERTQMPLLKTSIVFCIEADTEETLKQRVDIFRQIYRKRFQFHLEQPRGDQLLLFHECLPCADIVVTDYIHYMEPDSVAAGMFGATKELGDTEGFCIGTTGYLNRPVYFYPGLAAKGIPGTVTNSLSASFTGSLGGGKSFAANLLVYLTVLSGGRALVVDPKGERGNWLEDLKFIKDEVQVITLTAEEQNRGLLDPFLLFDCSTDTGRKAAEELAMSVLTFLLGVRNSDIQEFSNLSEIIEETAAGENPCMKTVISLLLERDSSVAKQLGRSISAFERLSFALLLFGNGERKETIHVKNALNVLQIQGLQLPGQMVSRADYNLAELLSVAMMLPIAGFANKFIATDRSVLKVVLFDEAWHFFSTSQGKELMQKLLLEGRAMNAAIYFLAQNIKVMSDSIFKNNIGMKFAFRSTDTEEVAEICNYFDIPATEGNMEIIKSLHNGQALMKDIYGRVGVVNIQVFFKDLYDAFDTRPPEQGGDI